MPDFVTKDFNRVCSDAGVQCTVTTDTTDWKKVYQFKNLGIRPVEVSTDKVSFVVRPNEEFSYKADKDPNVTKWFVSYQSLV